MKGLRDIQRLRNMTQLPHYKTIGGKNLTPTPEERAVQVARAALTDCQIQRDLALARSKKGLRVTVVFGGGV